LVTEFKGGIKLKELTCPICGEKYEVPNNVQKVMCAECRITGEAPIKEDGIEYYSPEAFKKLVNIGIENLRKAKRSRKKEAVSDESR